MNTLIVVVDMVFSLDSIITAVGMVNRLEVMIAAVILSVALMMAFSVGVEMLNIRLRKRSAKPVNLREAYSENEAPVARQT